MSELKIVRGNTFFTRSEVVAKTYDGTVIQDFDLSQATDIAVVARTDYARVKMTPQEITGNNLDLMWKNMKSGRYGLDVSGVYNGLEWRFYNKFVLSIVESNDDANIPQDCIIRENFYLLDVTTLVMTAVEGGGGSNVQSDWAEDDSSNAAYIKNKPTIPSIEGLITQEAADARYAQLSDIPTIPSNVSAFVNDAGYLTSYTETDPTVPSWAKASSKPTYTAQEVGALPVDTTIPDAQIQSDWNQSDSTKKDFIKNKPTIPVVPTNVSSFTNDAGYLTQHQDISGKANSADLATVATSGSYNDLQNKPTIPDAQIQADWEQADTTKKDFIKNKPTIPAAQVQSDWNATSGMGVILNKPSIPTVPANVGAFTNDAGYITSSSITNKANKITIVNYGTSSTTTTLSENIYYIWGEVASLTLTLGTPADASKLSEYMFEFQSGDTPTTLSLPSSVKWVDTPTIEANKTYQVSIVNDIAIIVGV